MKAIRENNPKADAALRYRHQWDYLSIQDGAERPLVWYKDRLVVPHLARPRILALLHTSHAGVSRTQVWAKQHFFWPGMKNDIVQLVSNCDRCVHLLPRQAQQPIVIDPSPAPMHDVSLDLFECKGKQHLLMVDRYSGFLWVKALQKTDSHTVIKQMNSWFMLFGFPRIVRTDGGPQFRHDFGMYCKAFHIEHRTSAPYNPQGNGQAEAGVKSAKFLMLKMGPKESFELALLAWQCTPRSDGISPAEAFFQRPIRSTVPLLIRQNTELSLNVQRALQMQKMHDTYGRTRMLSTLAPGEDVFVRNPRTRRWTDRGTVLSSVPNQRSYRVQLKGNPLVTVRDRRDLRPRHVRVQTTTRCGTKEGHSYGHGGHLHQRDPLL